MLVRSALVAVIGMALASCGRIDASPPVASVEQAIVGGAASEPSQDSTVMLVVLDASGARRVGICTAALVAPNLVLTARHCVARTDAVVACNADGTPLLDARVYANHDARGLYVFTGRERAAWTGAEPPALDTTQWRPAGRGAEIIDDGAGTLCDHDLALVLLEQPIASVPIASLRLDGEVGVGEKLRTVGWGVTREAAEPETRQQRDGVSASRVGPSDSVPMLTRSEFLFGESICLGDSGGPVYASATNAIVGVVSRGGNGADPTTADPASTCIDADNLGTKLAPFRDLVLHAFERAGAAPLFEPRPEGSDCSMTHTRGTASSSWLAGIAFAVLGTLTRRVSRARTA